MSRATASRDHPHRNDVALRGRVSAEPETRELPSGDTLVTLRLVVDRPPRDDSSRRRVDVIDVARRSDQLLDALGLDEAADKIVADYSAGMTQKIGLACALIHAPRVWARGSSSRR